MKMTYEECAKKYGITVEKLRREMYDFAQCEGFDGAGNEYHNLDEWLRRKPRREITEEDAIVAHEQGKFGGTN